MSIFDDFYLVIIEAMAAFWLLYLLFYLSSGVEQSIILLSIIVLVFSVNKSGYYVLRAFEKVEINKLQEKSYYKNIGDLSYLISSLILSFSADYYLINFLQPNSFSGLSTESILSQILDLVYFTSITFATIGYGDIVPVTIYSKLIVVVQLFTGFVLVVYLLSNINNIKPRNRYKDKEAT